MPETRWNIAPYFLVDDVVATANFYRDKLGFQYDRFWGDPPAFCMVWRRGIVIMLSQQGGVVRPNAWVDDADALHSEFVGKGVTIARGLCDQIYGNRDFDIEDPNGYRICFGHDIESKQS